MATILTTPPKKAEDLGGSDRLSPIRNFGSNPGRLKGYVYVPSRLAESPGLVVVLHGCTQTAAGFDVGTGWSTLAERYGFVVLYPEQRSANNPRQCFNWFRPADVTRGRGEAASIAQMVASVVKTHGIDPGRVFATGLSAGGAMTAAMLATYPEVFAGGAIIAGLPYRAAESVREAFEAMFQGRSRAAAEWGSLVRGASRHKGPWPKVSIWHGGADTTVVPGNAGELVKQWTDVHGLPERPSAEEVVDGHPRQVWCNDRGEVVIESYAIASMAHGTPLGAGADEEALGRSGPFLLDVGISSSYHIAKFWGLTGERLSEPAQPDRGRAKFTVPPSGVGNDASGILAKALQSGGLIKR